MPRKTLISTEELTHETRKYIEMTYGDKYANALFNRPRKDWTDLEKVNYRNARSTVYTRLRVQLKKKAAKMWIETLTAGNLKPWLNNHGITVSTYYNGAIQFGCKKLADYLVRYYIENTLLPELEEEMNITGVQMAKGTSACCLNCLDFSRAEIKEVSNKTK